MLNDLLQFIPANEARIAVALSTLFSILSILLAKWPAVSKAFGTFALADIGRMLRFAMPIVRWLLERNRARKVANRVIGSLMLLVSVSALPGCALFRQPLLWDVINAACESDLAKTAEAQAKAKALGVPVEQIVEVACKFADVIEPYVRQQTAARQGFGSPSPTAEAVAAAKARGVL